MTEVQLVEELKNGNERYLKYLYTYFNDVKRFITQNSGNEDDAKDVLQDVIIAFYNNLRSGKYKHSNLKGYILTMAKYNWFDRLDKLKTQKKHLPGLILNEEEVYDNEFELGTPSISLGQYIQAAIDKLGEPCKSLIMVTVYLKAKMEQVAEKFGYADAHSARQQKSRCLKKLRGFVSYDDIINLT